MSGRITHTPTPTTQHDRVGCEGMKMPDLTEKQREARRRLGELFDHIDAETLQEGEPSLRQVVSDHARAELAKDNTDGSEA